MELARLRGAEAEALAIVRIQALDVAFASDAAELDAAQLDARRLQLARQVEGELAALPSCQAASGAVTAMAGVLLNLLLGLSRVLLAMARRRELPAALDHVSEVTSSPTRAVWAIGAFISALVLLADIKTTWSFSALTVLIYYGLTNLSALRLPVEARRFPRPVAWMGLVSCFGLALFIEWQVWLAGLGLLALGFIVRAAMRHGRA